MPKQTLVLDSSQIKQFMMCPLSWYYQYKSLLRMKGLKMTAADMGSCVHSLLDDYYCFKAAGHSVDKAAMMAQLVFKEKETVKKYGFGPEVEEFILKRYSDYIIRYMFEDFTPAVKNGLPGVELGFSKVLYEDDYVLFIIEGRIDLVTSIAGQPTWVDHKTQDRISYLYWFKPQFLTYAYATGYDYGMINYFGLQKDYMKGKTFRKELINFPRWMIIEWEEKLKETFYIIAGGLNSANPEEYFKRIKNEASCGGAFETHPCMFVDLCETEMQYRGVIKNAKYDKVEAWSPW